MFCTHCKARHVDRGDWATKNHSRHLCEHCHRFFFTKPANVGVSENTNHCVHDGGLEVGAFCGRCRITLLRCKHRVHHQGRARGGPR